MNTQTLAGHPIPYPPNMTDALIRRMYADKGAAMDIPQPMKESERLTISEQRAADIHGKLVNAVHNLTRIRQNISRAAIAMHGERQQGGTNSPATKPGSAGAFAAIESVVDDLVREIDATQEAVLTL